MKHLHRVVRLLVLLLCAVGQPSASQTASGRASGPRRDTQAPPPGWSETLNKTLDMTIAGKDAEVVAIYEKWVAEYPNFSEAHAMLASAHAVSVSPANSERMSMSTVCKCRVAGQVSPNGHGPGSTLSVPKTWRRKDSGRLGEVSHRA